MNSKKPFEYIEEKIKQAADNSLPAFDERAWQAMEAKLDEGRKKRKSFLWWFILPVVLAGAWGLYVGLSDDGSMSNRTEAKNNFAKQNNNNNKQDRSATGSHPTETGFDEKTTSTGVTVTTTGKTDGAVYTDNTTTSGSSFSSTNVSSNKQPSIKPHIFSGDKKLRQRTAIADGQIAALEHNKAVVEEAALDTEELIVANKTEKGATIEKSDSAVVQKEGNTQPVFKAEEQALIKTEEKNKPEEKPAAAKKKKDIVQQKGWYLLAAIGADAGSTKFFSFSNSNATPKYGVGIGYQLNKKWSVQTGFYSTNKKYIAGSQDYKIKPGSPMGMYTIEKIKASCQVYEIPLSVRYNIVNKPTLIFFATAGAASYIMQKEKYDCYYWYYDDMYEKEWQYSGNRHFFSTAIFSIGIEKPVSPKLSLLAEPSLGIPLSGVGDGKMNIYSAAALLGIKYYPFKK